MHHLRRKTLRQLGEERLSEEQFAGREDRLKLMKFQASINKILNCMLQTWAEIEPWRIDEKL